MLAEVLCFDQNDRTSVCIQKKCDWPNTERCKFLESTDNVYEPFVYPLLFPHGDFGWDKLEFTDRKKKGKARLTPHQYLKCRLFVPEIYGSYGGYALDQTVSDTDRRVTTFTFTGLVLPANRFQLMSWLRMGEHDMFVRIEDYRLQYIQSPEFQKKLRVAMKQGDPLPDITDEGENLDVTNNLTHELDPHHSIESDTTHSVHLPASITGSPRHLKKLASNAFSIVRSRGRPFMFVTLTFNKEWAEVKSAMAEHESVYDRPDITCRVFKHKLESMLERLRNGAFWGPHTWDYTRKKYKYELGKNGYVIHVIEYQKRGLSHTHVIFRPSQFPEGYKENVYVGDSAEWVDELICCEKPSLAVLMRFHMIVFNANTQAWEVHNQIKELGINTPEELLQRLRLCVLGSSSITDDTVFGKGPMEHKHPFNNHVPQSWCTNAKSGECKSKFPKSVCAKSVFKEGGWCFHKRGPNDVFIVSYNPWELLRMSTQDQGTHLNVELCASVFAVGYLYKYVFKGVDTAKFWVSVTKAQESGGRINEAKEWQSARYLSAMEAVWRTLGNTTYA